MSTDDRRAMAIEESRRRHMARRRLRFNNGRSDIELCPEGSATDVDVDGLPEWENIINVAAGPTYMNGRISDRTLRDLADQIYRYLDMPPPAVRIDFQAVDAGVRLRRRPAKAEK